MRALLVLGSCKGFQRESFSGLKNNILVLIKKFTQAEEPVFILKETEDQNNYLKDIEFGNYVLYRKDIDAFFLSGLEKKLRIMGIREIVLCGEELDRSILFTAISGYDRGFRVLVVKDAVSSENYEKYGMGQECVNNTIFKMLTDGDINTVNTEEILNGYNEVSIENC